MSRSRRHTPIIPITTARSEAAFKAKSARILRSRQKMMLKKGDADALILPTRSREVVETYKGPKDGKQYLRGRDEKLLRK